MEAKVAQMRNRLTFTLRSEEVQHSISPRHLNYG